MSDPPRLPRRRSIRLQSFNYSHSGSYFVTIVANKAKHIFGEIILGETKLSAIGKIVSDCWLEIPNHFLGVELSEHIIMPNHLHGIIRIRVSQARANDLLHPSKQLPKPPTP
jgi:putative transposase